MTLDMLPRYAPERIMTIKGMQPVTSAVFHPAGNHEGSPIKNEMAALELTTPVGSRWFGCEWAYINSELRMVVIGCDFRDEVRKAWQTVPPQMR